MISGEEYYNFDVNIVMKVKVHLGKMIGTAGCHLHNSGMNGQLEDWPQPGCVHGREHPPQDRSLGAAPVESR